MRCLKWNSGNIIVESSVGRQVCLKKMGGDNISWR